MTATTNQEPTLCQWWTLCDREAVGTRQHPILGAVPICLRCWEKVEALSWPTHRRAGLAGLLQRVPRCPPAPAETLNRGPPLDGP
jgi:hypothetical protein